MRRSHRGYSGYRGRRTSTDVLRIVAVVLGVLVVLVVAALLYAQSHLVYTDDGVRVELPFGLFREEEPLPDPGNVSVVEGGGPEDASAEPGTSPAAEPAAGPLRAVELPLEDLLRGTARDRLEELDADALVVELKDETGQLAWQSGQSLAGQVGVNGDEAVNRALEALEAEGVTVIARLTCFRDDAVPYYDTGMALRSGEGNWRDELGLRWMSPASQEARDYLTGLCGELAALGVDEIVLEQFTFPTGGELSRINGGENYDPARFAQQVEAFLAGASQTAAPYGTQLSLRLEGEELSRPADSGLTSALAGEYACRIWAGEGILTDGQIAGLGGADRLVSTGDRLEEAAGTARAVLLS